MRAAYTAITLGITAVNPLCIIRDHSQIQVSKDTPCHRTAMAPVQARALRPSFGLSHAFLLLSERYRGQEAGVSIPLQSPIMLPSPQQCHLHSGMKMRKWEMNQKQSHQGEALVTTCYDVFAECVKAIDNNELIQAVSQSDKEFHFQNWFQARLIALGLNFDEPGRNTYPDFRLVHHPEGYEIKGLAVPGRDKNYDSNSQVPTGLHYGRSIFYVFGRYPKDRKAKEYPVIDLVLCHGDFLNIDHEYVHKNKSMKGFGSYGDIMIRDRKMYVVPTPFALTTGTIGNKTLIVPESFPIADGFVQVGSLERVEAQELVVGYSFDLRSNELTTTRIPNPGAGTVHRFTAYRLKSQAGKEVTMAIDSGVGMEDEEDSFNEK